MTDLTELWEKGELKAGYYYVKNEFGNIFPSDYSEEYDSINDSGVLGFWNEVSEITEVMAKVPTYEEYQRLNWYAGEGIETITALKSSLRSAMELYQIENNNCKTLAQKLLQVKPELREWLEVNYKEYL